MMQSSLWQMVHTRTSEDPILDIPKGSARRGRGQAPRGNAPPNVAMQNNLMCILMENHGAEHQ
jgi:hypothetical protein